MTRMKKGFMTLFATLLLAVSAAAPASAQPVQFQDGLVNVAIGDVEILNDARIGVAAAVAAAVCGVKVGPVAVLATQVDAGGPTATVCTVGTDPVTIEQNN